MAHEEKHPRAYVQKTGFFGAPPPPLPSPPAGHTHRRLQQGGPAGGGLSLGPSYRMGDPGIEPSPRTPYIEPPPAVGEWGANRVMSRVLSPVGAVHAAVVCPPPHIGGGGCLPPARGRGLSFRSSLQSDRLPIILRVVVTPIRPVVVAVLTRFGENPWCERAARGGLPMPCLEGSQDFQGLFSLSSL